MIRKWPKPRTFSGGYQNCVYTFHLGDGTLTPGDTIKLIEGKPKYVGAAAGLDVVFFAALARTFFVAEGVCEAMVSDGFNGFNPG